MNNFFKKDFEKSLVDMAISHIEGGKHTPSNFLIENIYQKYNMEGSLSRAYSILEDYGVLNAVRKIQEHYMALNSHINIHLGDPTQVLNTLAYIHGLELFDKIGFARKPNRFLSKKERKDLIKQLRELLDEYESENIRALRRSIDNLF